MPFENRGGVPRILRQVITTTGERYGLRLTTKFSQLSNEGANIVRVYFTQADFDANANYIELAAATGYHEGPIEIQEIWFRSLVGPSNIVAIFYARRG